MNNRTTQALVVTLALVSALALSPSAPAQTFKKVNVQHKAKMAQIASGGASVWGLDTNGHPYLYKGTTFVQVSTTITLAQIAVGGGNVRQPDTVWALDAAGGIYNVVKSGTTYVFNPMPGVLSFIAVGPGYEQLSVRCHRYEVWGLNPSAQIYRFNYCLNNWEQIPGTLQKLSVGAGWVWGINGYGEVYQFVGAPPGFFRQIPAYWPLTQISVGPSGIWGLRLQDNALLHYNPYVQGTPWELWETTSSATGVWVGGDGVWVIRAPGNAWNTMFIGGGYPFFGELALQTSLVAISAGSGGGVWGLDSSGQVFAFSTP